MDKLRSDAVKRILDGSRQIYHSDVSIEESSMTASIRIEENGPLRIEGEFDLICEKGEKLSEGTWMKIALCRCGRSQKKPLCDGSHKKDPHQE